MVWIICIHLLFSHRFGIIIPTGYYFSEGLKPPTRYIFGFTEFYMFILSSTSFYYRAGLMMFNRITVDARIHSENCYQPSSEFGGDRRWTARILTQALTLSHPVLGEDLMMPMIKRRATSVNQQVYNSNNYDLWYLQVYLMGHMNAYECL